AAMPDDPPLVDSQHHMDATSPQPASLVEPVRRPARAFHHGEDREDRALGRRASVRKLEQDRLVQPRSCKPGHRAGTTDLETTPARRPRDDDLRASRFPDMRSERAAIEPVEPNAAPAPAGERECE